MSSLAGGGMFLLNGGWAYWPISDYYSLTPKWDESHSVTGIPVDADDEPNRCDLVAGYNGPEPYLIATIMEDDTDTTGTVEENVPTGTPVLTGRLWLPYGFMTEYPLNLKTVVATGDDDVDRWTGGIYIGFPDAARRAIGPGNLAQYIVNIGFEEDPYASITLSFGTVVFRRTSGNMPPSSISTMDFVEYYNEQVDDG